jgi:4-amino-4-deoxy-L-arabinose transferase-like glycosyltransferase
MGSTTPKARLLVMVVGLACFAILFTRSRQYVFPPENDQAYYLMVARNIAEGRGLVQDVVWHHLRRVEATTGPSNDYWMPLTSILIAPFWAAGDGPHWARLAPVAWTTVAALLVFFLARRMLGSDALGATAAITFALHPLVRHYGSTSDSSGLYTALLMGALLLYGRLVDGGDRPQIPAALALGCLVGLAILTRADALTTLVATGLVTSVAARLQGAPSLTRRHWATIAIAAAVVASLWAVHCRATFGSWWSPATGKTLYMLEYDDLFAFSTDTDLEHWWQHATDHPGAVLGGKLRVFFYVLAYFFVVLTIPLAPLVAIGLFSLFRSRQPLSIVSWSLVACLALAYGAFANVLGLNQRNLTAIIPIAIIFAIRGCQAIVARVLGPVRWQRVDPWIARGACVIACCIAIGCSARQVLRGPEPASLQQQQSFRALKAALDELGEPPSRPLISSQPCQLNIACRRPAIMLPSDGNNALLAAAEHYGAHLLVLDDRETQRFPAARAIYEERSYHPAINLVARRGSWKIFALRPEPSG